MKRCLVIPAAVCALILAGCSDSEARRFGYKGLDLEDGDPMFFSTGPTVTNWVPARVLSVCEDYDMTAEELKLISAAGVIMPSAEFAEIPADYQKKDEEPWFTTWAKPVQSFGLDGVAGFLSHFDEDRKVWTTSETYFSSYWKTEAEALTAMGAIKAAIREGYGVKKFYDFKGCWVAEYVRLRVMTVVGQKADGTWSCMLDIQDKNRPGCGQWEPVADQQERLDHYRYTKAVKAWRAEIAKVLSDNHAAVEQAKAAEGLTGFAEASGWSMIERPDDKRPCLFQQAGGTFTNALDEAWAEKLALVKASVGLAPAEEPTVQKTEEGAEVRTAIMQDARYDVRLDVALLPDDAPTSVDAAAAEPRLHGEWRVLCFERLQPGMNLPPRPTLAK